MASQASLIQLPCHSRWVPTWLENIIDKKISKIALNILERLVDRICFWLYPPYKNLYKEKLSRIHQLEGKPPFYDATQDKIVSLEVVQTKDAVSGKTCATPTLSVRHKKLVFNRNDLSRDMNLFNSRIEHVTALQDEEHPTQLKVELQERATPGTTQQWSTTWTFDIAKSEQENALYPITPPTRRPLTRIENTQ